MNKQEFLAMSIFSNLKYLDNNNIIVNLHCIDNGVGLVNFGWGDAKSFNEVKPILRPLSDITKEIEHESEKFVPLSEITEDERCNSDIQHLSRMIINLKMNELVLNYPFWVVQKLVEWHFAVGLDKSEYVDVNSLSENPYK